MSANQLNPAAAAKTPGSTVKYANVQTIAPGVLNKRVPNANAVTSPSTCVIANATSISTSVVQSTSTPMRAATAELRYPITMAISTDASAAITTASSLAVTTRARRGSSVNVAMFVRCDHSDVIAMTPSTGSRKPM